MPLWIINDAKPDRRYGVDINSIYVPSDDGAPQFTSASKSRKQT
jgi:hypothetical protein